MSSLHSHRHCTSPNKPPYPPHPPQINVLVQSIAHAVSLTLQASPQGGGEAGASLSRDVSALQRLVNASVIALRNASAAR